MLGPVLLKDILMAVPVKHVEDVVSVIRDVADLVMLAVGCEYLDTASCIRRVDVAWPKREVFDLVADLWRE